MAPAHLAPPPRHLRSADPGRDHSAAAEQGEQPAPESRAGRWTAETARRLEQAVELHFDSVWRILRRFGVPLGSADDAAQHVFLKFADRLSEVQPDRERAFLLAVAVRVAANARRLIHRAREAPLDELDETHAAQETPEQLLERKRRLAALERALNQLSFEQRSVFVLFELEGFTLPEIAQALSLPLGTATSRLLRARKNFELAVLAEHELAGENTGVEHD